MSIAIIFVILFVLFGNARDAGLVLLNVPYAAVGGIVALLLTRFNFSISAGIGFIALFGICIQNGVIMISDSQNPPSISGYNLPVASPAGRLFAVLRLLPYPYRGHGRRI